MFHALRLKSIVAIFHGVSFSDIVDDDGTFRGRWLKNILSGRSSPRFSMKEYRYRMGIFHGCQWKITFFSGGACSKIDDERTLFTGREYSTVVNGRTFFIVVDRRTLLADGKYSTVVDGKTIPNLLTTLTRPTTGGYLTVTLL